MGNKLFDLMNQAPVQMPEPMKSFQNLRNQFGQFKNMYHSMYQGEPCQVIPQLLQTMVNSGRLSQNQINQAIQNAQMNRKNI